MEWAEEMPPKTPTFLQIYPFPFLLCDRKWLLHKTMASLGQQLCDSKSVTTQGHEHILRVPPASSAQPRAGRVSQWLRPKSALCPAHLLRGVCGLSVPEDLVAISGVQWREMPCSFVGYALLASIFPVFPNKYLNYNFGALLCFEHSSMSFLVPAIDNRFKVLKTQV